MQANKWLRKLTKDANEGEAKIIKPTDDQKKVSRELENAMSMGNTVIFEDANETFDPLLDPVLSKQLKKEGGEWVIKFGDGLKSYDLKF